MSRKKRATARKRIAATKEKETTNDAPFKLAQLPCEILGMVYERLPNMWNVISLRQTNKSFNAVYLQWEATILKAQRQRLVEPYLRYLTFLTKHHVDQDEIVYPNPDTDWLVKDEKSKFALSVLNSLPYIADRAKNVLPYGRQHDYSDILVQDQCWGWQQEALGKMKLNPKIHDVSKSRHSLILVGRCEDAEALDTMHGTMLNNTLEPMCPASFWHLMRMCFEDGIHVMLPYKPYCIRLRRMEGLRSILSRPQRVELRAMLKRNGWPHNFHKEKLWAQVGAWLDDNLYV